MQTQLHDYRKSPNYSHRWQADDIDVAESFSVFFEFHILPPSSLKHKKNLILWTKDATARPDLDNMEKFYLDCGTGIFWSDDKKIVRISSTKYYSENPKTLIKIIGHKPMDIDEKAKGILSLLSPQDFDALITACARFAKDADFPDTPFTRTSSCVQSERTARIAYFISELASKYGKTFARIANKFPEYHKQARIDLYPPIGYLK